MSSFIADFDLPRTSQKIVRYGKSCKWSWGLKIRSIDRAQDLGEVFTPQFLVSQMLDCIDLAVGNRLLKVLEPACGDGNFLIEIFERRLRAIAAADLSTPDAEFASLQALSTLYGIDIDKINVEECRARLSKRLAVFLEDVGSDSKKAALKAADAILATNVLEGDSIHDAVKIVLVDYIPQEGGFFAREQSFLEEPERDLFFEEPLPLETVHYLELGK